VRHWSTRILAATPETHESEVLDLREYTGPVVPGITLEDAQRYCNTHGLGYCRVIGEHIAEVDYDTGKITPSPSLN